MIWATYAEISIHLGIVKTKVMDTLLWERMANPSIRPWQRKAAES